MYRDEIFLKLNKHTGFNKYTGVVYFAQSRKKIRIFQKNSVNFGKIQIILEKIGNFQWKNHKKGKIMQGKLLYRLK